MSENMTCRQILCDLKHCDDVFPGAAIEAARLHRDEIIPGLIAEIDEATEASDDRAIVATWGHIAALFLLMEFDAKEAFPAILLSMCSADVEDLYGDFITEDLKHIAARLAEGPEQLALVINDLDVYEYVRGAFVDAVFGMVCLQRISREVAIQFLRDRLRTAIENEDTHAVTKTVEVLGMLLAEEARIEVKAAEEADLVDETWIGECFFEKELARGPEAFEEAKDLYLQYHANISADNLCSLPSFNQKQQVAQTLDSVLQEICRPFAYLPMDAVRWARSHREEIKPHLIQIIQEVPELAKRRSADSELPETHAHIVALYLLTEFGSQEILPTLLDLLSDSDEGVVDCFLDVVDQDMAQILGRFADEPSQLKTLISNPDVNEMVRRDAVEAIVWMATEGKIDRNQAIALLLDWLQESRESADTFLTTWIADSLMDLGATQACQTLVDACDAGEMEEIWICTEEIEDALSNGNNTFSQTLENHHSDRIENTVTELRAWDWDGSRAEVMDADDDWHDDDLDEDDDEDLSGNEEFRKLWLSMRDRFSPEQLMEFAQSGLPNSLGEFDESEDEDDHDRLGVTPTIRLDSPKVGRNDPCPCGSGKKYKKCCAKSDS